MKMTTTPLYLFASCFVLGAVACGSPSSISLGVAREKSLSALSPEERATACRNALAAYDLDDAELKGSCVYAALKGGATADACSASLTACVDNSRAMIANAKSAVHCDDDTETSQNPLFRCAATVGQWEDCYGAVLDATRSYYEPLTCTAALPSTAQPSAQAEAACAPLRQACPDLVGGAS